MTGPTREEVRAWKHAACATGDDTELSYLERFAALAFAAGSRSGEDARDAARYRWLREHKRYRLACVLGIDPAAIVTRDMVEHRYKILRSAHHPDKGGSTEAFHAVTRAYEQACAAVAGKQGREG